MGHVTVEFFGVPRQRAGVVSVSVPAGSIRDVLAAVVEACPGLRPLFPEDRPGPHVLVSVNGERFVTDSLDALPAGTRLVVLSADAGG